MKRERRRRSLGEGLSERDLRRGERDGGRGSWGRERKRERDG